MTLVLTGSINLTSGGITTDRDGVYSGSFSGSLVGDGSGLTGVTGGGGSSDFPYTGSAIISGSLEVDGITEVISGSIIGDGSGLTDVQIFPFEGQADIIGGFKLDGEFEFNHLSSSNGAWSAGGSINVSRYSGGGTGTQNASLIFGGLTFSPTTFYDATEAYNGTSWSVKSALIKTRDGLGGAGSQNSALAFGGRCNPVSYLADTEEYNGSSWSVGGDLNVARNRARGTGTQNAALTAGGQGNSPTIRSCTEEYNGVTWSNGGVLNTNPSLNLWEGAVGGSQNAGIYFGGADSPTGTQQACTEEYNGTSWSVGGALNSARRDIGGSGGQGTAIAFGGAILPSTYRTCVEEYDGSSWSNAPSLTTARSNFFGGSGDKLAALAAGGLGAGSIITTATEEYNADACYRKHFYSQQNTVYSNQLYVTGSATADALLNLANRDTTPDPLTEGMIWQSGSANSGCLYFSPDGTSICKISFA